MSDQRRIIIIAGPNGAGKTTFARTFLPNEGHCTNFINADLIAAGLSPFHPDTAAVQAGRLMLSEIDRHVGSGDSFAFETTLAGRSYARQVRRWQQQQYNVTLLFLKLLSEELAIARVAARVAQGGHNIPEDVIRRRYRQGWTNFEHLYRPLVNHWELYDNSGDEPQLLDQGDNS